MQSVWLGWALACAALLAGFIGYGWRGLVLASSVIVFWLLLQFSRGVRTLRLAAQAPVGHVTSAVMLQSRLAAGMRLPEVVKLSGSLGRKVGDEPETFEWRDAGAVAVAVAFGADGRCLRWQLHRPDDASP